jgi:hypothetical protein
MQNCISCAYHMSLSRLINIMGGNDDCCLLRLWKIYQVFPDAGQNKKIVIQHELQSSSYIYMQDMENNYL